MSRNRTKAATIAFVLMFTIAATLMTCLPIVNATENVPTYAFLAVSPNPVGVSQTVVVTFWLDKVPPTANTVFGDRWENMTLTVTKPGGTTQTLGPYRSDDVGAHWTSYVPDTVGTWYFQMSFPGQHIVGMSLFGTPVDHYYQPSTSPKVALTVQQAPIEQWPAAQLPTDYWQRPIEGENREWASISGDWLMTGYNASGNRYNPYSTAPKSAHIVWTYPVAFGGVVGGNYPDFNYYTGLAYEGKFGSFMGGGPVIMYGRLYFNLPLSDAAGSGGLVCIDLRTGQQLWWKNTTSLLSFGQQFDYVSPNQYGVIPYLWSTGPTYQAFDPMTGEWLFSLENASTGVATYGPNGELLVYVLNAFAPNQTLTMWNSTRAIMYYQQPSVNPMGNVWTWRPLTVRTMDWRKGIQWEVTVPSYPGQSIGMFGPPISRDVLLATTGTISGPQNWQMEIGYSAKDGHQLWVQNRTLPTGTTTWALMGPVGDGVYTEFHESTMQWYGYDLNSGRQIWGPTEPYPNAYGMYSWQASIAYGKLLAIDFGGYLHAYDIKTGEHLWDFFAGSSGYETVYGAWPLNNPQPISADGKIYVVAGHAYNPPLFRGARMYCLDAKTGNLLWSELGFYTYDPIAIADGYLVAYNCYDAQVYCYGKGKTATTVSAPTTTVANGSSVLIQGTVTDQSPGVKGTPAVSDTSMSDWMAYLYMQKPCPTNTTGVPVKLEAFGADGSVIEIGTVTSDPYGNFKSTWTPPDEGLYTIMATFAGSDSYWSSYAAAGLSVGPAPAAPPQVEIPAYPDYTPTILGTGFAIIIAIAVAILILRKRP